MKKNIWAMLLIASMAMTTLIGCGTEDGDSANSGETIDIVEETVEETEAEPELFMTLDANGMAGGVLSVTQAGEEGIESVAWDFSIIEGETVGSILEEQEITAVDVILEGDNFEGWIEYKVNIVTDADGFDTYVYEKVSGDTYYTTEELMDMPAPDYNVLYVAKWENVSLDEYYMTYEMVDDGLDLYLTMYANGGTIWNGGDDGYESTLGVYSIESDMTLGVMMGDEYPITSVEMDGYSFAGWTVYTGETVEWTDEEATDLDETAICLDFGDYGYAVIYDYDVYGEYVSTEELYEIVCEGTDYVVIAAWE